MAVTRITYRGRKLRILGSGWVLGVGNLASGSLVLHSFRDTKTARIE